MPTTASTTHVSGVFDSSAPENARAQELAEQIARRIASAAPAGWERLTATFALTADQGVGRLAFTFDGRTVQFGVDSGTMRLAREQREVAAESDSGPWWRMILRLVQGAEVDIEYDHGDTPFPEGWLLAPESYEADLARYPRRRLPVWLAAYLRHGGRQGRTPQQAGRDARADAENHVRAQDSNGLLPEPALLWAWWAVLSAGFVAAGSPHGPRILPSLGAFEGAVSRSGSTLYLLPGGRAVLSGGAWNAPELDAAYNDGAELPNLYAGAPHWIANSVLNPRAGTGLLSFCYWHDGRGWFRGASPHPDDFDTAIPGVRVADMVRTLLLRQCADNPTAAQQESATTLVASAQAGTVTRDQLTSVFDAQLADIDGALYQLEVAGLTSARNTLGRKRK